MNHPLANHLVKNDLLDATQASSYVLHAKQQDIPFISYLVKNNILTSKEIAECCAANFGLTIFDLKNYSTKWIRDADLHPDIIQRYRIIPLQKENNILHIGLSDPTDRHALDAVTFHTSLTIHPVIIFEDQLTEFINQNSKHLILPKELTLEENPSIIQENPVNYDEPLIKFVDNMIRHAIQQSASDIHIEPHEKNCRIRYRQDGILYVISEIPIQLASRLATRLKVMAKLDIAEKRLPQDGRLQQHAVDIRINTCPTLFGEKIVLRLLNSNKLSLAIDDLGFTETQKIIFTTKISQPQGLILVTGPTGSGKTMTLYSALQFLNHSEKNILTVEDPIEVQLNGINQVHINPKIGLDFSNILRTFLRQDPDIIMVGEIRDKETAEIAMQAAQTGHLVLSTLHANNAIETLTRLQAMGLASHHIISSISLIIAQRLIRKVCLHCTKECEHCLQGYQGRTAIYEFLPLTDTLIQLILSGATSAELTIHAKKEGFISLYEAGLAKVAQGITSLNEINRVITHEK